jgi:antitoxin (DNA-binding transcriptional repressor) of toxin-antitoxin stability system
VTADPTGHVYELPPDDVAPADAVHEAAAGDVVYLTRRGERVAALVPLDVAAAGAAALEALEALEDAEALRAAQAALADPAPSIPLAEVLAEHADVLTAYPDEER